MVSKFTHRYTGGWVRNNITTICNEMSLGYRKPRSPKRDKARITFRGSTADYLKFQMSHNK